MNETLMLIILWVVAIMTLSYGIYGLKNGKIRAHARALYIYKDLKGKWAYIYSLIMVILGGALLLGLIYNSWHCALLSVC